MLTRLCHWFAFEAVRAKKLTEKNTHNPKTHHEMKERQTDRAIIKSMDIPSKKIISIITILLLLLLIIIINNSRGECPK